ncbi:hypothetical protein DIPPA_17847 [Diplonema papillatum]|nr:hypothetical protein DIPPA_17847 [Diplonema papillatum]
MVKSYKKKDERPQKAVSDLRSQGQEQQQLDYLASMHLQAPWAVQYPNQYRQHPLGAPVTKHTHTYIT